MRLCISLLVLAITCQISLAVCPVGDMDGNCSVGIEDLVVIANSWLAENSNQANLDGIGRVDIADFAILADHWLENGRPLVINELMSSNSGTIEDPDEAGAYPDWIELYNPSSTPVDIGGMYLTDTLSTPTMWQIPANAPAQTTIQPGDYLLIWADEDMQQGPLHVGFKLSAGGEAVGLFDSSGNAVDTISFSSQTSDESYGRYPNGGPGWQKFKDGTPTPGSSNGGESADLGIVINEIMYHPGHNELLYEPEPIQLEYIEIANTGTSAVNLSGWRLVDGVSYTVPANTILGAGNYLVIAADPTAFSAAYPTVTNRVGGWVGKLSDSGETVTLVNAAGTVIDSVHYYDEGDWTKRIYAPVDEWGFRGFEWSNAHDGAGYSLELGNPAMPNEYGQNWAASTVLHGTPGTANSAAQTQSAPFILDMKHTPLVPVSGQAVTVTARILDELAAGLAVTLRWRVDQSTFTKGVWPTYNPASYTIVTMADDGLSPDAAAGDGIYTAQIPAQADKAIIEFFVRAEDSSAHARTCPAPVDLDGTDQQIANWLYQVDYSFNPLDGAGPGQPPLYRLIMTNAERVMLSQIGDTVNISEKDSNAQTNCTFISIDGAETKCRYNVHSRDRGQTTRSGPPNNFRVNFRRDDTWKGVSAINLNSKYTWLQTIGSAVMRTAAIATYSAKSVRFQVNGTEPALTDMARTQGRYTCNEDYDGDFTARQFPLDPDGDIYKCVNWVPVEEWTCKLEYLGSDPALYADAGYSKQTNTANADWSGLIDLTYALDMEPDATYVAAVEQIVNVDQWLRWFAAETLVGNNESNLSNGRGDDYQMYQGVTDPRFMLLPHDLDTCLGGGDSSFNPTTSIFVAADHNYLPVIERFLKHPAFVRKYYAVLLELMDTAFLPANINSVLEETLGGFVSQAEINRCKQFVVDRNASALSQIPLAFSIVSDLTTSNSFKYTTSSTASLHGTANAVETYSVLVNGQPADYTVLTGAWTISNITLNPGINRIIVQTFDSLNGTGNKLKEGYMDIWYDDSTQSTLSGTLAANTILDAASGPWHITGDVIVPVGITLTVQAGTTLFFDASTGITVNGRLAAEGSDFARIRLTRVPGGSSWDGIAFNNTLQDNRLEYIDMEYGDGQGKSIIVQTSKVTLDNVTWVSTGGAAAILDLTHPSAVIRNCVTPTITGIEPIHGVELTGNEYLIFEGNTFGPTTGYNDIIDFSGGQRPGPIVQFYNNTFMGGGDDGPDLDGTDAHVEGNLFQNFHQTTPDQDSPSYAVATGVGSQVCVVRNTFVNNDHAILHKEDVYSWTQNNTIVNCNIAAISFGEPFRSTPREPGKGTYLDSNIFSNNAAIFEHYFDNPPAYGPTGSVGVYRSMLPTAWHFFGQDNIDADPLFKDALGDWTLMPASSAIGTGSNGQNMGADVPAGATVSGEPDSVTFKTTADLTVSGPGITHYKYRLVDNGTPGTWSSEIVLPINADDFPIDPYHVYGQIHLTGLQNGHTYRVDVIGKNSAGLWQGQPHGDSGFTALGNAEGNSSHTWTVDTSSKILLINETLASNTAAAHEGTFPDKIELFYDGSVPINLGGYQLTDNKDIPGKFTFAAGTIMNPATFLVIYADTATTSGIHTGFALNSDGDDLTLTDPAGAVIDSVAFGMQLPDKSIGRFGHDRHWTLTEPTFGTQNKIAAKGDPGTLKINEWLADGNIMFTADWLEIYNPNAAPVDMGGLYLTDNPITEPNQCPIRPLSFVAGSGFAKLPADGSGDISFQLNADGEMLALYDADLNQIDQVIYGPQSTDVSQGRMPDGSDTLAFFELPTPGVANPATATTVYTTTTLISENATKKVLVPTAAVNAAWKGGSAFDDSAWNSGVFVAGKAGGVGYENNPGDSVNYTDLITYDIKSVRTGTCYIRVPFTLTAEQIAAISSLNLKIRRDDGFVAYINGVTAAQSNNVPAAPAWNSYATAGGPGDSTARQLAGYAITNTSVLSALQVGQNILAIHGMDASGSSDMLVSFILEIITWHTEGENTMAPYEALVDGLRITEIMYNPADDGNAEYIEFQNISDTDINLEGVRLTAGVDFTFPPMTLAPQQYTLVVAQQAAFEARYGTEPNVAGVYTGKLDNGGEQIILKLANPLDAAILRFDYADGWYPLTDGGGYSLVIADPAAPVADWQDKDNWLQSTAGGGSPGRDDTAPVIINEVLAHAHDTAPDWIELYNTTDSPVNIGGWTLSDNVSDLAKYQIADNTIIASHSYLVLYENTHFGTQFAFSENGESAYLTANTGGYTTEVHFGASETGVSFGRYEKSDGTDVFVLTSSVTPDDDNASPKTGPVVISEIMYNPPAGGLYPADDYEYIELHNTTASPITLSMFDAELSVTLGWQFTAGIDFTFPITTTIPANGYLIVARNPAAFTARYGAPAGIEILGPYANDTMLSNDGEQLELSKPGDTDTLGVRYYISVDAVHYKDQAPWPAAPDGLGETLNRINNTLYADDVTNWQTRPPTPGS